MQVQLTKPELTRYLTNQVNAGRFSSIEAAIEAAVEEMMRAEQDHALTDDDVAAINEAEEQIDRGEVVDFDAFSKEMRNKYRGH